MQLIMPTTTSQQQPQQQLPLSNATAAAPTSPGAAVVANASNAGNSSNSNNNPFGLPTTADGVPLFTVEQLQMLQRQTLSRLSQQQQSQSQTPSSSAAGTASAAAGTSASSSSSRPFMVVTQVPVQATALFAAQAQAQSQLQAQQSSCSAPGTAAAMGPAQTDSNNNNNGWAQFLQPTPLSPAYEQLQQFQQFQQHPHDQAQLSSGGGGGGNAPPISSGGSDPSSTSKQAASVLQQHFHQLAQQPKNPETEQLLQQLLRNAQAASQQVQQQQQQQQQPQQQQFQQPLSQAKQPLYALSSGVEPLSVSGNNSNDPLQEAAMWKMFLDEDEELLGKSGSGGMSGTNKRKLEGEATVTPVVGRALGDCAFPLWIEQPWSRHSDTSSSFDPNSSQTHPMRLGATTASWAAASSSSGTHTGTAENQAMPQHVMSSASSSQAPAVPAPEGDADTNADQLLFDPTPLSEILSMRPETPDESFSLSDQLRQFQLQHRTYPPSAPSAPHQPAQGQQQPQYQQMQQQQQPMIQMQPQQVQTPMMTQQQLQRQQQSQTQQAAKPPMTLSQAPLTQHPPQRAARGSKRKASGATTTARSVAAATPSPVSSSDFTLPSVFVPPSVLASVLPPAVATASSAASEGGGQGKVLPKQRKNTRLEAPQHVLERLLQQRGIRTVRIKADQAGYDTTPSPLQLASFGTELVKAIHTSDAGLLGRLLSAGLSANPCNQFRDSIVDLVCKRGNATIFQTLVEHGCDLQVCDGFGRTPLHHACWASDFCKPIAELILERDWLQLLIEDKRGQTPLEYVRADQADDWVEFLEQEAHKYLPSQPDSGEIPPPNLKQVRGDGYLPDPADALPVQLAAAVSSGQMTVEEVQDLSPEVRAKFL